MSIGITSVGHVNVTVPPELEPAAKLFYRDVLGMTQIDKPAGPKQFIGAWYQIGSTQLHLSVESNPQNQGSNRHVCYRVSDVQIAAAALRARGFEIIPDDDENRFFVRDPAGNMIEIAG